MTAKHNKRPFISIALLLWVMVILVTSVLMFSNPYSNLVAMVHSIIGFGFLAIVLWHIASNLKVLKQYVLPNSPVLWQKNRGLVLSAFVMCIGVLLLTVLEVKPLKAFHQWGSSLRVGTLANGDHQDHKYQVVQLRDPQASFKIDIDVKKGAAYHWPQYAIWLEDDVGNVVHALYVSNSVATNTYKNTVWLNDSSTIFNSNPFDNKTFVFENVFSEQYDETASNNKSRPESLPVFLHKFERAAQSQANKQPPAHLALDGYTGATVFDNFVVQQSVNPKLRSRAEAIGRSIYNIYLEINQAFDFNDYFSSDRFPNDSVYSGDGFNGQPSVIYRASVDFKQPRQHVMMTLQGRGHHSGKDGAIHADIENLTTALQIIDRVVVTTTITADHSHIRQPSKRYD